MTAQIPEYGTKSVIQQLQNRVIDCIADSDLTRTS